MNKILILVGGGISHLSHFEENAKLLDVPLVVASFSDLTFNTSNDTFKIYVKGVALENFGLIYFRLVGKRFEEMALVADFARKNGIKIIDPIYEKSGIARLPLAKSLETKLMMDAGLPVPETFYGKLKDIVNAAPKIYGYPFLIKGTTGKQGHAVWSPRNGKELAKLTHDLEKEEKTGKRFLAQKFVKASQRERVLVIGGVAIAAITRPTRWRKRFTTKSAERKAIFPIPEDEKRLAEKASKSLGIDIAGVDIIREDATGKLFLLEVNSAPRWDSIKKDTGINVEAEILKHLIAL